MSGPVHILETTVRDGGYEIGHDWSADDVALLVSLLDAAGFTYIEVGHGMGISLHTLPAEVRPKRRTVLSDRDHMEIARRCAPRAKIGMVLTPGEGYTPIGELEQLGGGAVDFVRLTYFPSTLAAPNLRYIERARELGLIVSINLMQTYVVPPREVARMAKTSRDHGAEWFYVVDSAGGMQPADVQEYVKAIVGETGMRVGLHAHNNGGQALANGLAAVAAGATLVDSTLNGMGRATGNPATEQLLLALQRRGEESAVDLEIVARAGAMVRDLFTGKGNDPLDFVSGSALIHSRNVPALRSAAATRGLAPNRFLVEVGREAQAAGCLEQFVFPAPVIDRAAERSGPVVLPRPSAALVDQLTSDAAARSRLELPALCKGIRSRASKAHKRAALHLVAAADYPYGGPLGWEGRRALGATIPWAGDATPPSDRLPDLVVLEPERAVPAWAEALPRLILSWRDAWAEATCDLVTAAAQRAGGGPWQIGDEPDAAAPIARRLVERGLRPAARRSDAATVAVLAFAPAGEWTAALRPGDLVVAAGAWADVRAIGEAARARGAIPLAPAVGAVIAARLDALLDLEDALRGATSSPTTGGEAWVEAPLAPGEAQALVQVRTGEVIDAARGGGGSVEALNQRRADLLVAGRLPL